jgi:hypothetical protein
MTTSPLYPTHTIICKFPQSSSEFQTDSNKDLGGFPMPLNEGNLLIEKKADNENPFENAWLFFQNVFLTMLNVHAPFKKVRTRNRYSPWFSPDLTALNQHKNILWRSA